MGRSSAGSEVAERLRRAVLEARPTGILTTISLGVSAGNGAGVDYDILFKAADSALYAAKRDGRNCVRVAGAQTPDLPAEAAWPATGPEPLAGLPA